MKWARMLGCGLAAVAAIALALAFLALSPRFQTWAVRRLLAAHPAWRLSVDGVAIGLDRVELRGVRWERGGAVLTAPSLEAELPVAPAAWNRRLLVRALSARGWTFDFSRAQVGFNRAGWRSAGAPASGRGALPSAWPSAYAAEPDAAAAAAGVFQGFFRRWRLPFGLELDGVDLHGTVVLPAAPGHAPPRVAVDLSGGGLAAGREGRFPFHGAAAAPSAPVKSLTADGMCMVYMDTDRTLGRFAVRVSASASGPEVPPGAELRVDFMAGRAAPGETYAIGLAGAAKQLAEVRADFSYATGQVTGTWKLDVGDADLAPFALGRALPAFEAVGAGRFATDGTFASIRASGRLDATTDRIGTFLPGRPPLGTVKLTAAFDAALHGPALRLDELTLSLDGPHPLLSVRALQAFEFDAGTGVLKVADPGRPLLDIALESLPLDWLQPYLPGFALAGGEVHGEMLAGARAGGLDLRPKLPLTIEGLSVSRGGRPVVGRCDVLLSASADYAPAGWQASVSPLLARDDGGNSVVLELRLGRLAGPGEPVRITGRLSARLPAISRQPALGRLLGLRAGAATCEFSGSVAASRSIEARLRASGLETETGVPLPAMTADLRVDTDAAGRTSFSAPIDFEEEGRKAELKVAGTVHPAAAGLAVDGRLESDSLYVEDLEFLGLLAAGGRDAGPAGGPPRPAPAAARWAGIDGTLTLVVGKLTGPAVDASAVRGVLRWDRRAIEVEDLRAAVGNGGRVRLDGTVAFDPGADRPYVAQAGLTANDIEAGPVFQALEPGRPPTLEGRFDCSGRLSGRGRSLPDLEQRLEGDLRITSRGGILRALAAGALPAPAPPGKTSAFEALVGDVVGRVTGRQDAANAAAAKARALESLAAALAEIHYDQIGLDVSRGPSLDTQLRSFALIAPEIRLEGTGATTYRPDTPWLRQPLAMQFKLGARGATADLLRSLGVLGTKTDELGYAACDLPLRIGGTLAHPDTRDLRETLLEAGYRESGTRDLIERLLGLK